MEIFWGLLESENIPGIISIEPDKYLYACAQSCDKQ